MDNFIRCVMDANAHGYSWLWRIDCPEMNVVNGCTSDDALSEAMSLSRVLLHAATNIVPMHTYVCAHTYTEPHHVKPSRYEVHALIRVLGHQSLSELTLREMLVNAIQTISPTYMDKYNAWEFELINEATFRSMYEEDAGCALADDI